VAGQLWWFIPIIPATWEAEIGRIMAMADPDKKLIRSHLNKQLGCGALLLWVFAHGQKP
jgi:hypothetical protein